jgi:hypothetical protein
MNRSIRRAGIALAATVLLGMAARALAARNAEISAPAKVQGVLIDRMCSWKAETRIVPGPRLEGGIIVAYTHTKQCALAPECRKSGYGIFTYEGKFVPFDEAGNQKALAFFKQSRKDEDYRVEVDGWMRGELMSVQSIRDLP